MQHNKVLISILKPIPKKVLASEVYSLSEYAKKIDVTPSAINMRIRRVMIEKTQKWDGFIAYNNHGKIVIIESKKKTKK